MTDKQTKHTPGPNKCICRSSDVLVSNDLKPDRTQGFRAHCIWCDRASAWHDTLDQALADWNQMTAAPDLLEALISLRNADDGKANRRIEWNKADAAIALAEPKS